MRFKDTFLLTKNKVKTQWFYLVSLLGILLISIYVRTRNIGYLANKYLLGLDPYMFFRYSKEIVEKGTLMAHDAMRYVPVGYNLSPSDSFFSHTLAYAYKLVSWTGATLKQTYIWYPVVAAVIGFIFFYLLVKELFGNKIALVATAFAAVIPAYIYRTGAGFADHEAAAMMWMFLALYLFIKAWKWAKNKELWKYMLLSAGSAVATGFMILTWGGYKNLLAIIGLFIPLAILFSKINRQRLYSYFGWFIITTIFLRIRTENFSFISSYDFLLLGFAAVTGILYILSGVLKDKIPRKLTEKVPIQFQVLLSAGGISLLAALVMGVDLGSIIRRVFNPTSSSRLGYTISENAQPFFAGGNGWMTNFGITTWLLLIGAILLFYFTFRGEIRYAAALTVGWAIMLASVIFGNYKPGHWINPFFTKYYFYIILLFLALFVIIYFHTYNKDKDAFKSLFYSKWQLLLVLGWFFFTLIVIKRSIRLVMLMAPIAAIVVAYFAVTSITWLWKEKHKVLTGLLVVFVIVCFISNASAAITISKSSAPHYPGQWENAYTWVRESTPTDAVFAHWWDYGHWTNTMGERACVVDGGNAMAWDHGMGRYGLLGRNPDNYLSYLKTHNVTHLLISAEEIGKFHAFATIGSDENWDLRSTIGIFGLQQVKDIYAGQRYIYGGGWNLDKDYAFGNKVFQEGRAGIIGFALDVQNDSKISNPTAVLSDGTQQYPIALNCLCQGGECTHFTDKGFPGCLILAPAFKSETEANPIGAAFFASEKVVDTNLVQMYIIGAKNQYFKEVYNDKTPLALYRGRVIGPIKIWEVQYPEGVKADAKYLERSKYG